MGLSAPAPGPTLARACAESQSVWGWIPEGAGLRVAASALGQRGLRHARDGAFRSALGNRQRRPGLPGVLRAVPASGVVRAAGCAGGRPARARRERVRAARGSDCVAGFERAVAVPTSPWQGLSAARGLRGRACSLSPHFSEGTLRPERGGRARGPPGAPRRVRRRSLAPGASGMWLPTKGRGLRDLLPGARCSHLHHYGARHGNAGHPVSTKGQDGK